MFNKLKNWWNKPWTNGTCIKWGLRSCIISFIIVAAELAWFFDWTPFKKK
mgnify:CR=1 FL=1